MRTEARIDKKRVEEQNTRKNNGIEISQTGANNSVVVKENVTTQYNCSSELL